MQRCAPAPAAAPALRGQGCEFILGSGVAVEQDVSVGLLPFYLWLQGPVVVVVWNVRFCGFLEPLHLQGASSNFLVLRIKAYYTIRVSHAWKSS